MVLRWLVQKVSKKEEFLINFQSDIDYALAEAHTTYGRMGIKVWIMKGEVYGKRDLSHLLEWTRNKLAEKVETSGNPLIKVENQTLVKESNFKLKKNVTA
jgi:ribosomal protein S3